MRCYPIELTPDDNGTFLVTCPALPEVATFGADEREAEQNAVLAIEEALAGRIAEWAEVPAIIEIGENSARLTVLPLQTALKVMLYRLMREKSVTRAELQRRLGWHREQVDRLFRLEHASKLDQIEAAFGAIGAEVEIGLRLSGPRHAA
jgi:antitoxin HicB